MEKRVDATLYDNELRLQCAYDVLRRYSHLLRPGLQWTDTKFIVLLTMCRMIDRSIELNTLSNDATVDSRPSADADDTFNLTQLLADENVAFKDRGSVARAGKLSTSERLDLMEKIVTYGEYF